MVSTTKERKPWSRPPISMNFQVEAVEQADASYLSCSDRPRNEPFVGPNTATTARQAGRPLACQRSILQCVLCDIATAAATGSSATEPCLHPVLCCAVQVPMFSASGLRVAYLKILERRLGSQYQVEKWVRKLCKSGDFLIRT